MQMGWGAGYWFAKASFHFSALISGRGASTLPSHFVLFTGGWELDDALNDCICNVFFACQLPSCVGPVTGGLCVTSASDGGSRNVTKQQQTSHCSWDQLLHPSSAPKPKPQQPPPPLSQPSTASFRTRFPAFRRKGGRGVLGGWSL